MANAQQSQGGSSSRGWTNPSGTTRAARLCPSYGTTRRPNAPPTAVRPSPTATRLAGAPRAVPLSAPRRLRRFGGSGGHDAHRPPLERRQIRAAPRIRLRSSSETASPQAPRIRRMACARPIARPLTSRLCSSICAVVISSASGPAAARSTWRIRSAGTSAEQTLQHRWAGGHAMTVHRPPATCTFDTMRTSVPSHVSGARLSGFNLYFAAYAAGERPG